MFLRKPAFSILLAMLCFLFTGLSSNAQVAGDYRTKQTGGDWSDTDIWEYYDGASWGDITTEGYPGELNDAGTVTIVCDDSGITVTLDVTPGFDIASLILEKN